MTLEAEKNIFSAELAFVPLFNLALQQNASPFNNKTKTLCYCSNMLAINMIA